MFWNSFLNHHSGYFVSGTDYSFNEGYIRFISTTVIDKVIFWKRVDWKVGIKTSLYQIYAY